MIYHDVILFQGFFIGRIDLRQQAFHAIILTEFNYVPF